MNAYMGIDIGTTNIKAAIFDEAGNQMAYHAVSNVNLHPTADWSEFDPTLVWNSVLVCLKESITQLHETVIIRSVGVSSMGESGILVDADGKALTNFVAWYDQRSRGEFEVLLSRIDAKKIFAVTGQIPSEKYGISKLMWQKRYIPKAYKKASHWLSMEDFILYRLTGIYATDYSIASRTMAFDIRTLSWSKEMADAAEVDICLFPPAYPGGTAIGTILKEVAEQTGMNSNAVAATGGHDHACAAVAVNIFEEGTVLDSMGTAEVSMICAESLPDPDSKENTLYYENQYSCYPHCGPKAYRILTSNQSCGICLEWLFRKVLDPQCSLTADEQYDELLKEAKQVEIRENSMMFFPFLRGAVENTAMRGMFCLISDSVERKDVTASVVEGLCLEFLYHVNKYEDILGKPVLRIRAVGGLCKSDYIMDVKSMVMGITVEVPVWKEAACLGAALLGKAAVKGGLWSELHHQIRIGRIFHGAEHRKSPGRYRTYLEMREQLKNTDF